MDKMTKRFFKELKNEMTKVSPAGKSNRKYVPAVRTAAKKYWRHLPLTLKRFIKLAILNGYDSDESKKYKETDEYLNSRVAWSYHLYGLRCLHCRDVLVLPVLSIPKQTKQYCSPSCRANDKGFQKKMRNIHLAVRGVPHQAKDPAVTAKIQKTIKENHGGVHHLATADCQARRLETLELRYGADAVTEVRRKATDTFINKYGKVVNPKGHRKLLKKKRANCLAKYGVDHPNKTPEARERMRRQVADEKISGKRAEMTLAAMATRILRYGKPHPDYALRKSKLTNLSRYGEEHHMQTQEGRLRHARAAFRIREVCIKTKVFKVQSSAEESCLRDLVAKHGCSNVLTQFSPTFPKNFREIRTFPDFYLPKLETFVEVKSTWTLWGDLKSPKAKSVLASNRKKASNCAAAGVCVRWVVYSRKAKVILPLDWHTWTISRLVKFVTLKLV